MHPRKLQRSGGTYFPYLTQSVTGQDGHCQHLLAYMHSIFYFGFWSSITFFVISIQLAHLFPNYQTVKELITQELSAFCLYSLKDFSAYARVGNGIPVLIMVHRGTSVTCWYEYTGIFLDESAP